MVGGKVAAGMVSTIPHNGELLLSYWRRIGGKFEEGFLQEARREIEKYGFFYERGHIYNTLQLTI